MHFIAASLTENRLSMQVHACQLAGYVGVIVYDFEEAGLGHMDNEGGLIVCCRV